jgi:hypothetical protein
VVVGRDDEFFLVDPDNFTIDSVDMLQPFVEKGLEPNDNNYPFDGPIVGGPDGQDANGDFKKKAPKLRGKKGDRFTDHVYMINWTGTPGNSGPHFKVFP